MAMAGEVQKSTLPCAGRGGSRGAEGEAEGDAAPVRPDEGGDSDEGGRGSQGEGREEHPRERQGGHRGAT